MRRWKAAAVVLAGLAATAGTCNNKSHDVNGTYNLQVVVIKNTCDGDLAQSSSVMTVRIVDNNDVTVQFADQATLTGYVDDQGLIQVQGTVSQPVASDIALQARFYPDGLSASARQTFDGTFPGVDGVCVKDYTIQGQKADLAPLLPTG